MVIDTGLLSTLRPDLVAELIIDAAVVVPVDRLWSLLTPQYRKYFTALSKAGA